MISCANKILSRSNNILSRRNKLKYKTRTSLPGFRMFAINITRAVNKLLSISIQNIFLTFVQLAIQFHCFSHSPVELAISDEKSVTATVSSQ